MKILLIAPLNSIHTKRWVKALSSRKIKICVFGFSTPEDNYYHNLENITIESANLVELRIGTFNKFLYLIAIKKLFKVYKNFNPDIVHAHFASSYGLIASFLNHKPFVISVWGADVYDFPKEAYYKKYILKRNLRKAQLICSTSKVMAEETKKYTSQKVEVVPFGVDIEHFKPQEKKIDPKSLHFGVVKTLEKKYGIKYLIKAFKLFVDKYPQSNHTLHIIGKGSQEEELKTLTQKLNLAKKVRFWGYIEHHNIPKYFNKMDVVIVPSILNSESFGVAAIEASACEKPVIASNVGGLPEVILDGKTGLVVEPKNVGDLFLKMDYFIHNINQIYNLGKAGRINVIKNYMWGKNVKTMIYHYNQITKET